MTEKTPTPDQLEAAAIGASMELNDDLVRAMVRTGIRDAFMKSESERLGGMVTLSPEASSIWLAAADFAVDRWLSVRDARTSAAAVMKLRDDDRFLAHGKPDQSGDYKRGVNDAADELFALMEKAADRIRRDGSL